MNVDAKIRVSDNMVKGLSVKERREKIKAAISKHPGLECKSLRLPTSNRGSLTKGNKFENELARDLSVWWTEGKDEHVFIRRGLGSGGAQRDRTGASGAAGDIHYDKPEGAPLIERYTFEAKFHKDLAGALWGFVAGEDDRELIEFWEQAERQARPYGRHILLVLRTNHRAPIVFSDHPQLWQHLRASTGWISHTQYAGCFSLVDLLAEPADQIMNLSTTGPARMKRKT